MMSGLLKLKLNLFNYLRQLNPACIKTNQSVLDCYRIVGAGKRTRN